MLIRRENAPAEVANEFLKGRRGLEGIAAEDLQQCLGFGFEA